MEPDRAALEENTRVALAGADGSGGRAARAAQVNLTGKGPGDRIAGAQLPNCAEGKGGVCEKPPLDATAHSVAARVGPRKRITPLRNAHSHCAPR